MSNEKNTSDLKSAELISKSLAGPLNEEEQARLDQALSQTVEARAFNNLSSLIQESVADIAARSLAGDASVAPGLPPAAKKRLRDSVRLARDDSGQFPSDSHGADGFTANDSEVCQAKSRFRLLRPIAKGGLGNVWLAWDEKIKRKVAIKSISPESIASPKAWKRFHREAEVTGQLEHPNVVPLYLYGNDPDTGEPFYVMRFLGKRTLANAIMEFHELRATCEADELGMHRLLTVFLDICQAIAYAHSRRVIHRDLKPENVALDNFGQVVVLDWGLAKLLDDVDPNEITSDLDEAPYESVVSRTMAGDIVGTPLYMAPEQAAGDHEKVDERTDVYGLGAILYAILTGTAPHKKTLNLQSRTLRIEELLNEIATRETPRARDECECVPRELERICLKAMAHQPFARYQSASDLAQAVELWMAGQSDKATRYENLRMVGRELRASFEATASTLETSARFVATLPPIHELMHVADEEELTQWRKRLATIFTGLLGAIGEYSSIIYSRVDGDQFEELVRVQRHSTDLSRVRPIPRSRLRTGTTSAFMQSVMQQNPDEVLLSLICDHLCDESECGRPRLMAGIPVYDNESEELFGLILISCNLEQLFERQMNTPHEAHEIMVACDTHQVMMHNIDNVPNENSLSRPIADISPHFSDAIAALQTQSEYLDESDHNIYGVRLWLIPRKHGMMYLLRNNSTR